MIPSFKSRPAFSRDGAAPHLAPLLDDAAVLLRGRDDLRPFVVDVRDRFLDVEVLALPHRLKRDRRMPVMRRGDDAGVDVLVVEHVLEAGRALRGGRLEPVDEPGRLLDLRGVDVAEPGDGDRLVAAHQPLDVMPHDAAATDDPQADRRRLVRGEPMNGPECRSGREQGRGLRGPLDEHAPGWFGIHPTLRGGRMSAREVRTDDRTIHTRGTDRLATPVQRLFNRSGVLNDTGRGRARQRCRSGVDGQPADLGHCRLLGEVVPQGVVDGFLATVEACHVGDFVHLGAGLRRGRDEVRHGHLARLRIKRGLWGHASQPFCEAQGLFAPRGRPGVLGVDPRPRAARLARRGPRDGDQRARPHAADRQEGPGRGRDHWSRACSQVYADGVLGRGH